MCVARRAQIIQNKKFAISLQYLKKEVNDKVEFLHAGKNEKLVQIGTMILMGWSSISKVFEIASLQSLCNIAKKELEMKFIFCIQINIKVA